MNIAQPVSADVDRVEFTFLSDQEIQAISVKLIENESTFDNLLNPVPGGLYDNALGSWGDSPCQTCNLNQASCPGHPGHIQFPVPVYHPVFIDQVLRLLRATCVYCSGFRLSKKDLHKYVCRLRLLQYGLITEAHMVGSIGENDLGLELPLPLGLEDSEAEEEESSDATGIIKIREKYVQQCLSGNRIRRGDMSRGKHEGNTTTRREVIKEFMSEITKKSPCSSCGGISPSYRKDRSVKIFEKSLTGKEKAKMAQKQLKWSDALARKHKSTPLKHHNESPSDEGIADSGTSNRTEESPDPLSQVLGAHEEQDELDSSSSQRYISSMEVKARLAELFKREQEMVSLLYNSRPPTRHTPNVTPDMFFLSSLLVPPNRFRPEARTGDSRIAEAQQNSLYKLILRKCGDIARAYTAVEKEKADMTKMHQAWIELQEAVNALVDKNQNPIRGAAALRNEEGIKQILEKKEGLFRMNMMGKRVNYAARSVISPDPNIETNEIGVPPVFAKKLTYPEPVTSHNFRELQQAVINGVDKWPGAFAIENENGQMVNLGKKSVDDRISLANQLLAPPDLKTPRTRNKKVHRHLTNGDVVLMNRQPTLHKPSIMGHRVRVLSSEKTLRMHYANCNTYNADFDGDEMNMHFPQNELARAEALQIADTDHQYLSGTAGKPLRGLIQDHISVSVALCNRDTVFNQGDYHQLIYGALRPENGHILGERIQLVPPALIKPVPRWTGKQVITTILKNIRPPNCGSLNMRENAQIKAEQWGVKSEEGIVFVQEGELITGILDKSQIGPSSGGLVHAIHETYGPAVAGRLLSCLGRLLSRYLGMRAFSCGMDDLKLTSLGESSRRRELLSANKVGLDIASSYVSLDKHKESLDPLLLERLEEVMRDDKKQEGLDLLVNEGSNHITEAVQKACLPNGLEKHFPKNQMQTMTTSGAKGTRVNASLISCNLGQQVLEGRRVPVMVSGKTLPCFRPFETHIRAGGYIVNRFLTGIRPQEYYFHHMAGREGLIDTAVKTSRSGYLQRCVIKGMEGLTVAYDSSVRDADGSVVQFLYGEDGLDVTKQKYLYDFGFTLQNVVSEAAQLHYDFKLGELLGANRAVFSKYMKSAIKRAKANDTKGPDPLISSIDPASNAFATSESFYDAMATYVKDNADGLVREKGDKSQQVSSRAVLNRKNAEMLFAMKYLRSLVEPGEAVGIIAGQSVGEPSTQMTLNTFHLAGHSAKNVTLGIPRLREILMTASQKIARPSMTLHVLEGLTDREADAFAKSMSRLRLGQLLDRVVIEERVGRGRKHDMAKIYRIALSFFPSQEYCETYAISVSDVMRAIEVEMISKALSLIKKEVKKRRAQTTGAQPAIDVQTGVVEMANIARQRGSQDADEYNDEDKDGGNDEDEVGDGDATSAKQQATRDEAVSYAANDEEDDAVQQANENDEESDGDGDAEDEGLGRSPPRRCLSNTVNSLDGDGDQDVDNEHRNRKSQSKARRQRVLENFEELTSFECDEEEGHWCTMTLEFDSNMPKLLMLTLVQEAVRRTVVRQVAGVGSCILETNAKGERLIQASGVNLRAMQEQDGFIDTRRIQTNEIGAVLAMYGVEACRASIVTELADVFGSHGIKVDNRHLNLIADFMTRNGEFTAFNRIGLKGNVSPFTKMSFETTLAFLKDALLAGDWDDLTTPSSRLVTGKLGKVGTGGFDVLTRLPTNHSGSLS